MNRRQAIKDRIDRTTAASWIAAGLGASCLLRGSAPEIVDQVADADWEGLISLLIAVVAGGGAARQAHRRRTGQLPGIDPTPTQPAEVEPGEHTHEPAPVAEWDDRPLFTSSPDDDGNWADWNDSRG